MVLDIDIWFKLFVLIGCVLLLPFDTAGGLSVT